MHKVEVYHKVTLLTLDLAPSLSICPYLQPQQLQFVEREMKGVEAVEVAHGRRRRETVGGVLDEWCPVPFPDAVIAIATDDALSSFVRHRRTAKALNGASESNSAKNRNNGAFRTPSLAGRAKIWIFADQKTGALHCKALSLSPTPRFLATREAIVGLGTTGNY